MHPQRAFHWDDPASLLQLVSAIAFTRIFAATPEGPRVAHVPVIITGDGRLRFHLANTNALTPHLTGTTVLALTEGPNAYVSANWYVDIRGAVPTWNYLAAEVEGTVATIDRAALIDLIDALALQLEPRVAEDWTRHKMEPQRFEALLDGITGFELTPAVLRGTRKLSQNKSDVEVAGVIAGMRRTRSSTMAMAMREARTPKPEA